MYMGGPNQGAGRIQATKARKSSSKASKGKSVSLSVMSQSATSSSTSSMMTVQEDATMGGVNENVVITAPVPILRQSKKRDKILMERRQGEGMGGEGYAGDAPDNGETGLFRRAVGTVTDKPPPQKKSKSNHGKALKIHLGDAINTANAAAAAAGGSMEFTQSYEGFTVDQSGALVDPSSKHASARRRKRLNDKGGQDALVSPYVQGMAMDGAGDIILRYYHQSNIFFHCHTTYNLTIYTGTSFPLSTTTLTLNSLPFYTNRRWSLRYVPLVPSISS